MMTVNGPIHFLNKPLGNTNRKKKTNHKTKLEWSVFSQERLLPYEFYTYTKSNFLCNGDRQRKGPIITIPQVKSIFVMNNQHNWSPMPLQKTSK